MKYRVYRWFVLIAGGFIGITSALAFARTVNMGEGNYAMACLAIICCVWIGQSIKSEEA